jgi:hypothetical protein
MAKPKSLEKNQWETTKICKEITKKGVLTNKTGVKNRILSKDVGIIVSNQVINTSFCLEIHYFTTVKLDYLFINAMNSGILR